MADETSFLGRNVALRIVKPYPEARNHIYTGRALAFDGKFVAIDGCVLHFGKASVDDPAGGLTTSSRAVRWVALQRIEYIHELPASANPFAPEEIKVGADGSLDYDALDRPDLLPD